MLHLVVQIVDNFIPNENLFDFHCKKWKIKNFTFVFFPSYISVNVFNCMNEKNTLLLIYLIARLKRIEIYNTKSFRKITKA